MIVDKRIFTGGLDTDTSVKLIAQNDYTFASNVRNGVTEDSDAGELTNVKGNVLIPYTQPNGDNITIGSFFNYGTNKVYYFVHNSLENHHILEYDHTTQGIELILLSTQLQGFGIFGGSLLNFSLSHLITAVQIYQGVLYWTDDFNPPRKINIESAKNANKRLAFSDNTFLTGNKTGFITATSTPFVVGDKIKIVQDAGAVNPSYNVSTEITAITASSGGFIIETDIEFGVSSAVNPGYIYYENSYILPFEEEFIQQIKYPPLYQPSTTYFSDGSYNQNNLRGTLYQFRVQYIFDDFEYSAWSPISVPPLPTSDQRMYLDTEYLTSINNGINITVDTGSPIVKKVNIAVRKGNSGSFQLIETIDKAKLQLQDNVSYTYPFYNNSATLPIETNEQNLLFDKVPQLAKTLDIVNSNRIVLGNIVEDYDNVDIKVEMSTINSSISTQTTPTISSKEDFQENSTNTVDRYSGVVRYWIPNNFRRNQTYSISVQHGSATFSSPPVTLSYTTVPGDTEKTVYDRLATLINALGYSNTTAQSINTTVTGGVNNPPVGDYYLQVYCTWEVYSNSIYGQSTLQPVNGNSMTVDVASELYPTLKKFSWFQYGIVYYDYANRSGATNISPQSKIYIDGTTDVNYVTSTMRIYHFPPTWATHYQIVRSKNLSIRRYVQMIANSVGAEVSGNTPVDLTYRVLFNDKYKNSNLSYTYVKGDRCRVLDPETLQSFYDFEVVSQDLTTNIINIRTNGVVILSTQVLELYTPEKDYESDKQLYYEIGECHPVINVFSSTGYKPAHGRIGDVDPLLNPLNNTAIQDPYLPNPVGGNNYTALELNDWSDYLRSRGSDEEQYFESMSFNDLYSSDVDCTGRPNIVSSSIKQVRRPTTIYYSEPFSQDTEINGLSRFFDFNFETYDNKFGSIQKLFYKDNRLICFFEDKIANIPVNQQIFYGANGQSTVGLSDQVLNVPYWYEWEGGISLNPESFANYGNNCYFADVRRGVVCRLGGDGVTPISEYKMHNYFTDKCARLMASGVVRVLGVYDRRFSNYIISFTAVGGGRLRYNPIESVLDGSTGGLPVSYSVQIDTENALYILNPTINNPVLREFESPPDTLAFNETTNRWISHYTYYPEFMSRAGTDIVTFVDGKIYLHNQTTIYNNYYGVSWPTVITTVSNMYPSNVKVWESIGLESTEAWQMTEAINENGQETSIELTDFEDKENMYYAYMRGDINTLNVADPIINGDVMRDVTMTASFTNPSQNFLKIFAVNFGVIISNLHNK